MPRTSLLLLCVSLLVGAAFAQVIPPTEIKDAELRALQERNLDELKKLGADILALPTDYPFYLSRHLDLDEAKQKWSDQRSIQFDRYKGKVVLEITGNYYAAYSGEKMTGDQRARETFLRILEPMLKAAVTRFQNNASVQAYAFEISHHVLGKVGGVNVERPENLVVILPQQAATRFVAANEASVQQSALLQGEVLLNAKPATIWLSGEGPQLAQQTPEDPSTAAQPATSSTAEVVHNGTEPDLDKLPSPVHVPALKPVKPADPPRPARDTSPAALVSLQSALKPVLDTMVKDLDPLAHFVTYAAPNFVAFRNGIYLELSINTALAEPTTASRYRLAALAFDEHVSHLIRPVIGQFKDDSQFDGIGFSANLHLSAKPAANASSQAVEFFFPFSALRCYERYDCTGQQLLDAGTVLINGERVSLDLQIAEGGGNR
ncbi:MAG: hypothetical protein LAO24_21530 [Acidobacteriia bacterium]|nr:hypothetical protein [Terriglobia bacterium]